MEHSSLKKYRDFQIFNNNSGQKERQKHGEKLETNTEAYSSTSKSAEK